MFASEALLVTCTVSIFAWVTPCRSEVPGCHGRGCWKPEHQPCRRGCASCGCKVDWHEIEQAGPQKVDVEIVMLHAMLRMIR